MMQGPSPKSQSEPSMSRHIVKVAPALICTTRSRLGTGAATPMPSAHDQAPRPRAEKGRQPNVQTRPRSVRTTAWASPTAMSTTFSSGGSMDLGSSEKPFAVPERERPGLRHTKQRPSLVRATLKLAPRNTFCSVGRPSGSCKESPRSVPFSCRSTPGLVQPPASCRSVADRVAVRVLAPRTGSSPSLAPASEETGDWSDAVRVPTLYECARRCGRSRAVARDFTRPRTKPITASSCGAGGKTSRPHT
mmetsp:Transcript_28028/g.80418  ORF Transcript_28028/g.80418 Transcript_28028/m.80418 type:complete len:248 (+) Transcript_28028:365-1108(+)